MRGRPASHKGLSLAESVCLALVCEEPTHGWALVTALRPNGEIGRIWSLTRPLTYRAIDRLVSAGAIVRDDAARRARLTATGAGRRTSQQWLDRPVEHLRDLRIEFLLKLELRRRAGMFDHVGFCDRQLARLEPAIAALTVSAPGDPVEIWRHESALAARRAIERVRASQPPTQAIVCAQPVV